jgi:hypothetical protein
MNYLVNFWLMKFGTRDTFPGLPAVSAKIIPVAIDPTPVGVTGRPDIRFQTLFSSDPPQAGMSFSVHRLLWFFPTLPQNGWFLYLIAVSLSMMRTFEYHLNLKIITLRDPAFWSKAFLPLLKLIPWCQRMIHHSLLKISVGSAPRHRIRQGAGWLVAVLSIYCLLEIWHTRVIPLAQVYNSSLLIYFLFLGIGLAVLLNYTPLVGDLATRPFFFWSGLLGAILLNHFGTGRKMLTELWSTPSGYIDLVFLLEILLFSLALTYRTRLMVQENQRIRENYTRELEAQLEARTREIRQQSQQLEQQHMSQLATEFERKLADTELVALRAQMNPHFIFNCLNSIKLYTLQNHADQASQYLSKFACLIRIVLENSRSEQVSLKNELEALRLYTELEAMRFKHKVKFSIHVSEAIDEGYLEIPPLLLQPYVENAIWHGLMHKAEGGTVSVHIQQPTEQMLRIQITDDGVGRAKAAQLESKTTSPHKSFGMQVTADRIRMINQRYNVLTQIQTLDLIDRDGEPCGTQVILEIPLS